MAVRTLGKHFIKFLVFILEIDSAFSQSRQPTDPNYRWALDFLRCKQCKRRKCAYLGSRKIRSSSCDYKTQVRDILIGGFISCLKVMTTCRQASHWPIVCTKLYRAVLCDLHIDLPQLAHLTERTWLVVRLYLPPFSLVYFIGKFLPGKPHELNRNDISRFTWFLFDPLFKLFRSTDKTSG